MARKRYQHELELRQFTLEDYDEVKRIMDRIYPKMGGA